MIPARRLSCREMRCAEWRAAGRHDYNAHKRSSGMIDGLAKKRGGQVERFGILVRLSDALLLALVLFLAATRLWLASERLFDPDEFEHLHCGYCLWRGQVPYRDFFEHHPPLLWYVSLPLFWLFGPQIKVFFACRILVWLLGLLSLLLTYRLAASLYGRTASLLACLLLLILSAYVEKSIEWRPDNLAAPLLLLAAVAISPRASSRGPGSLNWLLAGAALTLACLSTQKSLYLAVGFAIGASLPARPERYKQLGLLISGAIAVAVAALLLLAIGGYLGAFVDAAVVTSLRWQERASVAVWLFSTITPNPVFWSAALAGCLAALLALRRGPVAQSAIACALVVHFAGLLHIPAAFKQYYLLAEPWSAVLAAGALTAIAGTDGQLSVARRKLAALVLVAVPCFGLLRLGYFFLPHWSNIAILLGTAAAILLLMARYGALAAAALTLADFVAATPFLKPQYFAWSNRQQLDAIAKLLELTRPDDRILDGFTGYGALRPHAFYYFWINQHSWPLIPEAQKTDGLLRAIEDPRTRLVLFDKYLNKYMPFAVKQALKKHFRPTAKIVAPECIVCIRATVDAAQVGQEHKPGFERTGLKLLLRRRPN